MTFANKLLQKTESVAVFALAKRVDNGFELIFFKAPDDIYSSDLQASLLALNHGVEQTIAHCPEQYQWEYKRFRKNGKDYYPRKK